jgi:hypothetical protein
MSFFGKFCTPHPETWGALLQGLVMSGDRGTRTFKTLRAAMTQPYNYLALTGFSDQALDKARSRVLAALLRGVLAATQQSSRLTALSAAAASILHPAALSSSSSTAVAMSADQTIGTALNVSAAAATQAAVRNATVLSVDVTSSSSSSSGWPPGVQQAAPGLPLQQQPVHTRLQVLVVLQILQVLREWGVVIRHDAALAAALQVLRFCGDTEDARQSGAFECLA